MKIHNFKGTKNKELKIDEVFDESNEQLSNKSHR